MIKNKMVVYTTFSSDSEAANESRKFYSNISE